MFEQCTRPAVTQTGKGARNTVAFVTALEANIKLALLSAKTAPKMLISFQIHGAAVKSKAVAALPIRYFIKSRNRSFALRVGRRRECRVSGRHRLSSWIH